MARIIIVVMLLLAVAGGGLLYYQQIYAYYEELPQTPDAIRLTARESGVAEAIAVTSFAGIDADSSPLRYRACFETALDPAALGARFVTITGAEPRVAPPWFDCFDAARIGAALQDGATAFMGVENIQYGIDRIVAITPDGRGYSWHQINACGEVVFNREPVPTGCPPPPESLR